MNLYSMEIRIYATAYVRADSSADAMAQLRAISDGNTGLEFARGYQGLTEEICLDGRPYPCLLDNAEPIALSPAMTIDQQFLAITNLQKVEIEPDPANDDQR